MATCPKCKAEIEELKFFGTASVEGTFFNDGGEGIYEDEEYETDDIAGFQCPKCDAIVAKDEEDALAIMAEPEDEEEDDTE